MVQLLVHCDQQPEFTAVMFVDMDHWAHLETLDIVILEYTSVAIR